MTAALLDAANEALRNAVRDRLESTPADDPKMRGYTPLAGCQPAQECAAQVLADAWRDEGCCDGGRCQPKTVVVGQGVLNEWAEFERDEPRQTGDGVKGDASAGTTAKFGTGAIRSDTFEEFRYDLVSPIGRVQREPRSTEIGTGRKVCQCTTFSTMPSPTSTVSCLATEASRT